MLIPGKSYICTGNSGSLQPASILPFQVSLSGFGSRLPQSAPLKLPPEPGYRESFGTTLYPACIQGWPDPAKYITVIILTVIGWAHNYVIWGLYEHTYPRLRSRIREQAISTQGSIYVTASCSTINRSLQRTPDTDCCVIAASFYHAYLSSGTCRSHRSWRCTRWRWTLEQFDDEHVEIRMLRELRATPRPV